MRPVMHDKMVQALARVQEARAIALSVAQLPAPAEEAFDDATIQRHSEEGTALIMRVQHLSIRIRQVRKERAREYCATCALSLSTVALIHMLQVHTYERRKRNVAVQKKNLDQFPGKGKDILDHAARSLAWADEVDAGLALLDMRKLGRLREYTVDRQPLVEDILDLARAARSCWEVCDNLVENYQRERKAASCKERLASWKKRAKKRHS